MEDGVHIDTLHQHDVNFLIYPDGRRSGEYKTFWGHQHNRKNGEVLISRDKLKPEGVDNLEQIKRDINRKGFALVEGPPDLRYEDMIWTNTIFMRPEDKPDSLDFSKIKIISETVLRSLPLDSHALDASHRTVIASIRNPNGEEVLVFFGLPRSQAHNKLVGELHTVSKDTTHHEELVREVFRGLGSHGRVYLYGDDLRSLNIEKIANETGCSLIRRSSSTEKDFGATEARLNTLEGRSLDAGETVLVQGTPTTQDEVEAMGFPSASLPGWQKINEQIEAQLDGKFGRRIETKEDLIRELSEGNSDMLILVAHSDGTSFYLGGRKVTIAELEGLPSRQPNAGSRPRVAVLLSCFAGKFATPAARWQIFHREVKSLSEVLVNKNFVDEVLAPTAEITGSETIKILDTTMTELSQGLGRRVKGLVRIAGKPTSSGPIGL